MSDSTTSEGITGGKVVLVTGTSTGIGLVTAVALARRGWSVVATMRDLAKADRLREAATEAGVEVDIRPLVVTKPDSIAAAIDDVSARYGRLDALLNNAGAPSVGTAELMPLQQVRDTMEVNFFGVVALTQAALPLLRATGGQVATVTSVGGIVGQPFNDAYCAAKFAVEGFMEGLAPVAKTVGVTVSVIEPAAVSSEFVANAGVADRDAVLAAAGPYRPALERYLERTAQAFSPESAQVPSAVAEVIADHLDAGSPVYRVQTSERAGAFAGVKLADLNGARVQELTTAWVS